MCKGWKLHSVNLSVISGVPQGIILGPFLFLLFINDLSDIIPNGFHAKLFADDLKSYNVYDYYSSPNSVQLMLDSIVQWSERWLRKLYNSK